MLHRKTFYSLLCLSVLALASCSGLDYKKTKSGIQYHIISNGKDSLLKPGQFGKVYFKQLINDSLFESNYGKMPAYISVSPEAEGKYTPAEIFHLLRKGDSAIILMNVDSIMAKNGGAQNLPPFMKKGRKIKTLFKLVEIFKNDSLYQLDAQAEAKKDEPRRMKEQKEQMEKMEKEMMAKKMADEAAIEKSGEAATQATALQKHFTDKKITAQKASTGTFVEIKTPGSGPKVTKGKYLTVKYTGKILATDSTFESNTFDFQVGMGRVISGWDEGLMMFNEGGKGSIFIAPYKGYGKEGSGPIKPNSALKFDVEILKVSDTMLTTPPPAH